MASNNTTEQLIRVYKRGLRGTAEHKFSRDAKHLAKEGWRVQSHSQSTSLGKIFTISVVYVREVR